MLLKYFNFIAVLILLTSCSKSAKSSPIPPWVVGGTLYSATLKDWQSASESNKLATAAECLRETLWKGHLEDEDDYFQMRRRAELLVKVLDFSAEHIDTVERLGGDQAKPISEIVSEILHGEASVGENRYGPDE